MPSLPHYRNATLRAIGTVVALCALFGSEAAAQWSTLKGKFLYDGDVPVAKFVPNAQAAMCGLPNGIPDETLVVSPNKEIANVFVYVRTQVQKVHPNYDNILAKQNVILDNQNCMFVPHAAILWTKQTLEMRNSDRLGHNVNYSSPLQGMSTLIPPGNAPVLNTLKISENLPHSFACNIHPWMQGRLLVRDNPYFALSKSDGTFEIEDLPNGENLEFVFWHERSGYLKNIAVNNGMIGPKGRFTLKINGNLDLGDVKFKP